jgi:hypothetical protein
MGAVSACPRHRSRGPSRPDGHREGDPAGALRYPHEGSPASHFCRGEVGCETRAYARSATNLVGMHPCWLVVCQSVGLCVCLSVCVACSWNSLTRANAPLLMEAPQVKRVSLHNARPDRRPFSQSPDRDWPNTPLTGGVRQRGVEQGAALRHSVRRALSNSGTALSVDTAHRVTIALGTPLVLWGSHWNRIVA